MGKDVTLHVSASNPAMMLYQKFGFKAEKLVLDLPAAEPSQPNVDMHIFSDSRDSVRRSCHAPCFVVLKFHTAAVF